MSTNNANEYLARAAWLLRDHVAIADITGLGNWIAENSSPDEDEAGDGSAIASAIVDGLESLSGDECYSPKEATEAECMGHCKIGDDCYWWYNGAETNWQSDRPDWWEEQLEQYEDKDEVPSGS